VLRWRGDSVERIRLSRCSADACALGQQSPFRYRDVAFYTDARISPAFAGELRAKFWSAAAGGSN